MSLGTKTNDFDSLPTRNLPGYRRNQQQPGLQLEQGLPDLRAMGETICQYKPGRT